MHTKAVHYNSDPEQFLPDLTDTEDDILEEEFGDLIDEDRKIQNYYFKLIFF